MILDIEFSVIFSTIMWRGFLSLPWVAWTQCLEDSNQGFGGCYVMESEVHVMIRQTETGEIAFDWSMQEHSGKKMGGKDKIYSTKCGRLFFMPRRPWNFPGRIKEIGREDSTYSKWAQKETKSLITREMPKNWHPTQLQKYFSRASICDPLSMQ